MSQKYYLRKSDGEMFAHYSTISNGVILTKLDKENGHAICNSHYQFFVGDGEIGTDYEKANFVVPVQRDKEIEQKFVSLFRKMMQELPNYGCFEDGDQEATQVEYDCRVVEDLLFSDHFSMESLSGIVRDRYPEDLADEINFSEFGAIFQFFLELKNDVREIVNLIKTDKESV